MGATPVACVSGEGGGHSRLPMTLSRSVAGKGRPLGFPKASCPPPPLFSWKSPWDLKPFGVPRGQPETPHALKSWNQWGAGSVGRERVTRGLDRPRSHRGKCQWFEAAGTNPTSEERPGGKDQMQPDKSGNRGRLEGRDRHREQNPKRAPAPEVPFCWARPDGASVTVKKR